MAMRHANMKPEDLEGGYINAHGTSTPYNDKFETIAIKVSGGGDVNDSVQVEMIGSAAIFYCLILMMILPML